MTINCNGKIVDFSTPKVMGIININEDSFYASSRLKNIEEIVYKAEAMMNEGAFAIDIGAMSSRPGAYLIEPEKEWKLIKDVIDAIIKIKGIIISVDTVWSSTANEAIKAGVHIINDISAGNIDSKMFEILSENTKVAYIMMHMRGIPETMNEDTYYTNIVLELLEFFSKKMGKAKEYKIKEIIIDPGFGFSKIGNQNFLLIDKLEMFKIFECPILCGLSRKSMLYKTLGISSEEALNATTVVNTMALMNGCNILRVHDVKPAIEAVKLYTKTINSSS
ncbi:MAG: dihydropteroate synthase [Bacteroidota bacterium]|jgi:dihydropteroate synthase